MCSPGIGSVFQRWDGQGCQYTDFYQKDGQLREGGKHFF